MTRRLNPGLTAVLALGLILPAAMAWAAAQTQPAGEPLSDLARKLAIAPAPSPSGRGSLASGERGEGAALAAQKTAVGSPAPSPAISSKDQLPLRPPGSGSAANAPARNDASSSNWLFNTLLTLGGVIVLILILRAVLSKWSGRAGAPVSSPVVEVLSRVSIAPRNHLLLLRLGGRILVVGDSPAGLRTLANIRDPEEVAELLATISAAQPQSISAGFNRLLENWSGRSRSREHDGLDPGGDDSEFRVDRSRAGVSGLLSRIRATGRPGGEP